MLMIESCSKNVSAALSYLAAASLRVPTVWRPGANHPHKPSTTPEAAPTLHHFRVCCAVQAQPTATWKPFELLSVPRQFNMLLHVPSSSCQTV